MINLEEHKKLVYKLIKERGVPYEEMDDTYQDFCAYYYGSNSEYDDTYAISTWIGLMFRNFMSARAARWSMKKRDDSGKVDSEILATVGYTPNMELSMDMDRMYRILPPLFKVLMNTNLTIKVVAQLEGVSRQAIEKRFKHEVQAVRNQFSIYEGECNGI